MLDHVEHFRNKLIQNSRSDLASLAQILTYAVNYSRSEFRVATGSETDYHLSLSDALLAEPESSSYHLLFKPSSSIINKLWRKNQHAPIVHLGNISEHITDLVRTDISATTLSSAEFLANRMNALPVIIHGPEVRAEFDITIQTIRFEPEMKMESGYFAYHGLVRFKTGLVIEVQIYSDLIRQWRKLSHRLYEQARIEPIHKHEFNSKESRLISLGHLLHLAECQLQQLRQEFGGSNA
ncbi:MAG: hypothetical protein ABI353_24000 [Isosphaeraceae bacterium]